MPLLNESVANNLRNIKEKVEKYFTVGVGGLWLLSTIWDIVRFHCFWSDYMLELYSSFFIILMIMQFYFPDKIPKLLYDLFGVINTTLGRGIIDLLISLLFVGGKHFFHQFSSILLLIGAVGILVMEFLAPATTDSSKGFYPGVNNAQRNIVDTPPTKIDESQHSEILDSNSQKNEKLPTLEDQVKHEF